MTLQVPEKPKTFNDVHDQLQKIHGNIALDDLKAQGIRTEAPSVDNLEKGRMALVELSGVPYIYFRNLSGTIYKLQMTAA